MKNTSFWLSTIVISTLLLLLVHIQAADSKDFRLNLAIERKGEEYKFSLTLKYSGNQQKVLYVQNPIESGKTTLLTIFKKKEVKSITTTTHSPTNFTGIILDNNAEHEFNLKFLPNKDGSIYCREIDEKLSLFEKKSLVAAQCVLYVSDFALKKCDILEIRSNTCLIEFDHKPSPFPPPEIKPFDYSKLPPPP
jgi:hypothetical protein